MRALVLIAALLHGAAAAQVQVVATTGDLGALAREVGADAVRVTVLAPPTHDPHFIDPRPSLVVSLARADLLIANGLDLELGWLPSLVLASRNARIQHGAAGFLDGSTLIVPREVPTGKLDRAEGDLHAGGNPHHTRDPRNAVRLAEALAARLAILDPRNAAAYRARAAAFRTEAERRMEAWTRRFAPLRGTAVVPYHRSWIYLTAFLGLEEVAFVEPKPGLPPSSGHATAVLRVLRERKVPLILQEAWYPAATGELLSRSSGAVLLRVPGMVPEGTAYLDHLGAVIERIASVLEASGRSG